VAVHTISLPVAVLGVLVAALIAVVIGPLALVILALAVVVVWFLLGPGFRGAITVSTP